MPRKRGKSQNFINGMRVLMPKDLDGSVINPGRRKVTEFCVEHGISRKQLRKLQKKETKKMCQEREALNGPR